MVSTLALSKLEKYSKNIYEAVMVIAKRARQINEEQRIEMERELMFSGETEEERAKEEVEKSYKKLPKPTKVALDEMLQGKIRFRYKEKEEQG